MNPATKKTMEKIDRIVDYIDGMPVRFDGINYYVRINHKNFAIDYQRKLNN
jgi:hypothetical protein